jgi:ribosomal-protein-alanine N-acetyltransferase
MADPSNYQLFVPQKSDLSQFVALDQQCLGGMWSLAGYEQEWSSPNGFLLGLRSPKTGSRQLIGMGAFWQILEEAHITLLAIDPQFRNQGLGKYLLNGLLDIACQQQLERATLEVRASNHGAIHLYQQFGFQVAGRRKKYYPDQEDALILWLNKLSNNGSNNIGATLKRI